MLFFPFLFLPSFNFLFPLSFPESTAPCRWDPSSSLYRKLLISKKKRCSWSVYRVCSDAWNWQSIILALFVKNICTSLRQVNGHLAMCNHHLSFAVMIVLVRLMFPYPPAFWVGETGFSFSHRRSWPLSCHYSDNLTFYPCLMEISSPHSRRKAYKWE